MTSDEHLTEREQYRCKVIDEIVNTEMDYLDGLEVNFQDFFEFLNFFKKISFLQLMMRVFHEPLTKNKLLDKKTLAQIFGGIPELIALNRELVTKPIILNLFEKIIIILYY